MPDAKFRVRLGRCYELAGRRAGFTAGAILVHGSIQGFGHPRIGHAWVVLPSGVVWEPILDQEIDADVFREFFSPEVEVTYEREEVLVLMLREMHWGPWHD